MIGTYEQCIALRAITGTDGTPTVGTKSTSTNCLVKRYQHSIPQVILTSLHSDWIPDAVIIEGMFLINIKPWIAHYNLGDYAEFLLKQHIYPFYRGGSSEVHVVFDDPNCQGRSPKFLKGNAEARPIQYLKTTSVEIFLQIWQYH